MTSEKRLYHRDYARRLRAARRAQALCYRCGTPVARFRACLPCRFKKNVAAAARREIEKELS